MCALKWCIVWFSTRETGKKTKQNQLDQGQTVKHNSAHKNLYALGLTFEVSYLFQIKKKEIDIYIVSAECPWKVELHFAPFMLTLMHISFFFYFLPSWKLALLQREFQATDECRDVAAVCTHCVPLTSPPINAPEGFFSLFLSFHLPLPPPPSPWKTAVNGSSCNPSSGNVYFFLFKISFRYLNKCCCSSFTLVILTLWFSIFFFLSLSS